MTRLLYTLLLGLLTPLAFAKLWWRGRRLPAYRQRWGERVGHIPTLPAQPRLWVHAVSVGETLAAVPLVRAWQAAHPGWQVLVTTTTPTGSAQVLRSFGASVEHVYLPYDLPWMVHRFFQRTQPTLAIVMETEIWPNLFAQCAQHKVPLILANARLSDKSFKAYLRFKSLTQTALQHVTLLAARGAQDAERFLALGAHPEAVHAWGNLKFDLHIDPASRARGQSWRQALAPHRPVWMAASTHLGEDPVVLQAHRLLLQQHPSAVLLLAPRHPDRANALAQEIQAQGGPLLRRSALASPGAALELPPGGVFMLDTLGELMDFYAACDVAFVGGSLVPTGGHNPLEPLALELPVLSGPEVFNFREVYDELAQLKAVVMVRNAPELAQAVGAALDRRNTPGATDATALHAWLQSNQGSTQRLVERAGRLVG